MEPVTPLLADGYYPERADTREPFFDRLLANLRFRWHNAFARRLDEPTALAAEVGLFAAQWAGSPLAPRLPELRYALRRDGLRARLIAECFGLYCAGQSRQGAVAPGPDALGAAAVLLNGGIVELADASARREALALAAATWVICGVPVHLLTVSDARARGAAEALRAPLMALGFSPGVIVQGMDARARREAYSAPVICGTQREIANDYLRDRSVLDNRPRSLARALQRASGGSGSGREPALRGLHCALVEDADVVMLDDSHLQTVLTGDKIQTQERLIYEQALEFARALAQGTDYRLDSEGTRLTDAGEQRIGRLVGPLAGIWIVRQRREGLVVLALDVLHRLKRGADYQVEQGRVILKQQEGEEAGAAEADQTVQRLIEVKEGCKLGSSPEVLARLSVPRFLRRYLRLAGTCADAKGCEGEFWGLYGLKTTLAGAAAPGPIRCPARMFRTASAKRAALLERVHALRAAGCAVLIAARTPSEGQVLSQMLDKAGIAPGILRGAGGEAEQQALGRLNGPGGVALALHPAERNIARAAGGTPVSVIVAELHDARRQVERIHRAFAADSCELLLSLEDKAVAAQLGAAPAAWARLGSDGGEELPAGRSRWFAGLVQRGIERSYAQVRQEVMMRDRQLDDQLAFSGTRE
jgi:preprotein translocase subunit SecA